jgi:hypothetical protein
VFDIYLSYQSEQAAQVSQLKNRLRPLRVWFDQDAIRSNPVLKLPDNLVRTIRSSKMFICFLSFRYIESANLNLELELANSIGKKVLVVLVDKIDTKRQLGPQMRRVLATSANKPIDCSDRPSDWLDAYFGRIESQISSILRVPLVMEVKTGVYLFFFRNLIRNIFVKRWTQ